MTEPIPHSETVEVEAVHLQRLVELVTNMSKTRLDQIDEVAVEHAQSVLRSAGWRTSPTE